MLQRGRGFLAGLAATSLALGMTAGFVSGLVAPSPASGATSKCLTGIGVGVGAMVYEGATTTLAPSQSTARVGDTIKYRVRISTTATECQFTRGTVRLKTPDGVNHVLATTVALKPGASMTFTAPPYTVNNADVGGKVGTTTAAAGAILAIATMTGTAIESGGITEHVTATSHYTLSVIHPETILTKSASYTTGQIPLLVKYTFKEKNISSDPTPSELALDVLTTVHVTDTTGCSPVFQTSSNGTDTKLAVGATWTYTCTETFSTVGTFVDHATGTGNAGDKREAGTSTSLGAPQNESATAQVTTSPAQPTISTSQQPASGTIGVTVLNDKVTVSGLVSPILTSPGVGKITVKLYSPSSPTCTGTPAFTDTITASNGNGTYTTSNGPLANAAGTWHWTAMYSGDHNNRTAASGCSAEPVVISPAQPTISTSPQPSSGTIGSTALNDKVTLSGLVDPLGTGKITVKLYPPSSPTCAGTAAFTDTIAASSGNETYTTSGGPTANAAGTWHWTAVFSGDTNNKTATSTCATEPVAIGKATPTISTTQRPASGLIGSTTLNDRVTLSGLVDSLGTGTITVKLYPPSSPTCTGTPAFIDVLTASSGNGTYTTSGGPTANAAGTWHWTAVYSGDANNNTASSKCTAEPVTIAKASPAISTTPQPAEGIVGSTTLNDKVTLSGLVDPLGTGTITVKLYPPSSPTCTGTPAFTDTITASKGNGTYTTTGGPTANAAGTWQWTAVYSGDANNETVESECATEPVSIHGAAAITIVKSATPTVVTKAGQTVTYKFVVTNTGGTALTGVSVTDKFTAPSTADTLSSAIDCVSLSNPSGSCLGTTTNLAIGQSATFTASYSVVSADLTNGLINNSATASGTVATTTTKVVSTPSTASVKTVNLVVTKSVSPPSGTDVYPGEVLTYTLTFANSNGTAPASVNYTDNLSDVIDDATVTTTPVEKTGSGLSVGSISDGKFTITGTVPPKTVDTVTYKATVDAATKDTGNHVLNNYLIPTGSTTPKTCKRTNHDCTTNPVPAITIVKSATPTVVTKAGQTVTYKFVVTNTGGTALTGVSVTDKFTAPSTADTLSSAIDCVSLSNPSGSCLGTTTNLAIGQSATFTASYSVVSADLTNGVINNSATASGTVATTTTKVVSTPSTASVKATKVTVCKPTPCKPTTCKTPCKTPCKPTTCKTPCKTPCKPTTCKTPCKQTCKPTPCKPTPCKPKCKALVPGVTIVKSATPTVVTKIGQTITYKFVVTDSGQTALKGVSVTDKFTAPSTADTLSSAIDCVSLSNPSSTCSGTSTNLGVGQSAMFTASYKVNNGDVSNGVINNSATASGTSSTTGTKVISSPSTATVNVTTPTCEPTPCKTPCKPTPCKPTLCKPTSSKPTPCKPTPCKPTSSKKTPCKPTGKPTPCKPTSSKKTPCKPTGKPTPCRP